MPDGVRHRLDLELGARGPSPRPRSRAMLGSPQVDPGAVVGVVEHRTAADQGEVLLARLDDRGRYSESLASRSAMTSLRPLMPPCSLHHVGERDRGVVHLLVQAGPDGEALVGDRADLDRVGRSRPSSVGAGRRRRPGTRSRGRRSRRCRARLRLDGLAAGRSRRSSSARRFALLAAAVSTTLRRAARTREQRDGHRGRAGCRAWTPCGSCSPPGTKC